MANSNLLTGLQTTFRFATGQSKVKQQSYTSEWNPV